MLIYKDVITGDEMISDAYDMKEFGGGLFYEVECKMITIKRGGGDVNIGANASAEEAPEDLDDSYETVNNVVHNFRLQSATLVLDKKSYSNHLRLYLAAIQEYLRDSEASEEVTLAFADGIKKKENRLAMFRDIDKAEFYVGESAVEFLSFNSDTKEERDAKKPGMVALLKWNEEETIPSMVFWKHGLKAEKY